MILFDLDETLFDHTHASRKALSEVRSRYRALQSQTLESTETHLRDSLNGLRHKVLLGELSIEEARTLRFRSLLAFCGNGNDDKFATELAGAFRTDYQGERRPIAGIVPCPNPELAVEIRSFEPVEALLQPLMGRSTSVSRRQISRPGRA